MRDNIIDPAFRQPGRVEAYKAALRAFDWQFEFSDAGWYVQNCRQQLQVLWAVQRAIDPDGAIWRSIAGSGHGTPGPRT